MAAGTTIKHKRKAGAFVNGELQAGEFGLDVTAGVWYFSRNGTTVETSASGSGDMSKAEFATNGQAGKVDTAINAEQLGSVTANLYATKVYADSAASTAVAAVLDTAPATLDTLNELAAALGDDPNFAATTASALAGKAATVHQHAGTDITSGNIPAAAMQANVGAALQSSGASTISNASLTIDGGTI